MSVYLIATIELRSGAMPRFAPVMAQIVSIVETVGWKLSSAFTSKTGKVGTVIDVWELPDANHLDAGFAAIASDPRFAAIQAALQGSIITESLMLADRLTYPPAT